MEESKVTKRSRKPRIWYPYAEYHITSRGNRKDEIFRGIEDYKTFLQILKEAIQHLDNQYEVISYCLMTNHVHIQIKTKERHIKELMMRVNKFYAKYFNNKYNYVGHLFQQRYGSQLIDNDKYSLDVSKYIHLNPVRANIVKTPEQYIWSSYCMYIGKEKEKFINSETILSYFKNREYYKAFVENYATR